MGLGVNDVHVWTAVPEDIAAPAAASLGGSWLSDAERARAARFHFETDRHNYLVAHALVRRALSDYAPVAPQAWAFDVGEHGRPEVRAGLTDVPLRFNLSHTRGLVAVGVCLDLDIGVDVEHVRPRSFTLEVADHYFSAPEVSALRALPVEARRDRFFTYWTLKESYIKGRGLGLAIPLDQFGFDIAGADEGAGPRDRVALWTDEGLGDDASTWWFCADRLGADHRLAVAVRTGTSVPDLQIHRGEPSLTAEIGT